MDSLLDAEASKRQDSELIDFLLDIMPTYHRICTESQEDVRQQMEAEFCQQLLHQTPTERKASRRSLTLFVCRECGGHNVCVDTTLACLVCRQC